MKQIRWTSCVFAPVLVAASIIGANTARAANGTWNGTQDAMWTNSANWSAVAFPYGSSTATFDNAGNGNTSINLAGLYSFPNITFTGASVGAYTLGLVGQKVTLQNGNVIWLAESAAADQTVQTDLELPLSNSGITFRNDNPSQTLAFGKIYGYTTAGATKSVYVQGTGPIVIQGNLDRYLSTATPACRDADGGRDPARRPRAGSPPARAGRRT